MGLFRHAAISAQQTEWLGKIVVIRPPSTTLASTIAIAIVSSIVSFMACASYTARTTVSGRLMPAAGLVQVYVPQAGIVIEKSVTEGQALHRGDKLFVISGERQSVTRGLTEAMDSEQITLRGDSLREEMIKLGQLQKEEKADLERRIVLLEGEQTGFDSQLAGQRLRAQLAEQARTRSQMLLAQQFISREQFQAAEATLLEQNLRLQQLERERLTGKRELETQISARTSQPLRHQAQQAQLARVLSGTVQELNESEARRRLLITAPAAGTATSVTAERGQTVDRGTPLLAIIPEGSPLQAELYAPSRAIGFLRVGQGVHLRYQAFPYQKFGHASGVVSAITRSTLVQVGESPGPREEQYRVTVQLERQSVQVYGQAQPLTAGMALDADILRERRKLYEWVLEPLISLTGRW